MQSIKLKAKIGTDGELSMQLPLEMANKELELDIVVVYQPTESTKSESLHDIVERFYGCLADDPILVTEQTKTV